MLFSQGLVSSLSDMSTGPQMCIAAGKTQIEIWRDFFLCLIHLIFYFYLMILRLDKLSNFTFTGAVNKKPISLS